jgi:hypothetical protein
MMAMCVLACLEGRVISLMDLSRIDPIWINPNLLAHTQMRSEQIHHPHPYSTLKS